MRTIALIYLYAFLFSIGFPLFGADRNTQEILEILSKDHPFAKSLSSLNHAHKSHTDASGILPDPKIGFAYRNYPTRNGYSLNDRPLDTPTMTGMEMSISQEFPFPGKLGTEKQISKIVEGQANIYYVSGINALLSDLLLTLNRFQWLAEKKNYNDKLIQLLKAQSSVTEGYYTTGSVPLTSILKINVTKTEALEREIELLTAEKDLMARLEYFQIPERIQLDDFRRVNLNSYLEEKEFKLTPILSSSKEAIENIPEVKIAIAEEKKLREQSKLTKFELAPQSEVFFSYMKRRPQTFAIDRGPLDYTIMDVTEYRGDLFSFGLNMKIPVWSALNWDSITGEKELLADSGKNSVDKLKSEMTSELNRNNENLNGLKNQINLVEKKLIPEQEKTVQVSSSLYSSGKSNYQETLMAQSEILKSKIRLIEMKEKKAELLINNLKLLNRIFEESTNDSHIGHK